MNSKIAVRRKLFKKEEKMHIPKFESTIVTFMVILAVSIGIVHSLKDGTIINCVGIIGSPLTRPLHVEGKYIKDDLGNIVFLRGINKPNFASQDPSGWWQPEGGVYGDGYGVWDENAVIYNLDKMVELLGINALRFHLHVGHWYDNPLDFGGSGLTFREMLRRCCELASERGIYIILDGFNNGKGGGAGGQSPLPWNPGGGHISDPADFTDWWVSMSDYFDDLPNVIYDLWNEPHGCTELEWFNACQDVVNSLREKGDDHIVLYQFGYTGMESNREIPNGHNITGGNIVYSIHTYRYIVNYTPYFNGHYLYQDVENDMLNVLLVQNLIDAGLAWGDFEFGCGTAEDPGTVPDPENELIWLESLLTFCNNYNGSYTEWLWWDISRHYGILKNSLVYPWCPPLNEAGEILRDAILAGQI